MIVNINVFLFPFVVNLATGKRRVSKSGKVKSAKTSKTGRRRITRKDDHGEERELPPPPPSTGITKKKKRRRPRDEDY
jgi:hypothetical protein